MIDAVESHVAPAFPHLTPSHLSVLSPDSKMTLNPAASISGQCLGRASKGPRSSSPQNPLPISPLPTPLTAALPPPPLLHLASGEECTQDQDLQPYSSPVWSTFLQRYSSCRPPSASEHSSVLQLALWVHIWLLFQHSVPVSFLGAEAVSLLSTASF